MGLSDEQRTVEWPPVGYTMRYPCLPEDEGRTHLLTSVEKTGSTPGRGTNLIALKACALASEMLRAVGFERNYTSMKSEATYYQWPGCVQLLRVAEHKYRGREVGKLPCIATITFSEKNYKADQAGVRHVPRDDSLCRPRLRLVSQPTDSALADAEAAITALWPLPPAYRRHACSFQEPGWALERNPDVCHYSRALKREFVAVSSPALLLGIRVIFART